MEITKDLDTSSPQLKETCVGSNPRVGPMLTTTRLKVDRGGLLLLVGGGSINKPKIEPGCMDIFYWPPAVS